VQGGGGFFDSGDYSKQAGDTTANPLYGEGAPPCSLNPGT
jgi:hypothetical protein